MDDQITYLLIISVLSILFFVFKKSYLPKIKGSLGEYSVEKALNRLNKKDYIVYNDIYLKNMGYTSQIDHLVLSIYGIFVIETKNYKGWIFGNDKSKYWTQTLYKRKFKIYNPVRQNWAHVSCIKGISNELNYSNYIPIIVFTGSAKLKKINCSVPVIKRNKLIKTIKQYTDIYYSHDEIAILDNTIRNSLITGKAIKKEHNKNVKRIKANKNVESKVCPKCGNKLKIKQGKYGYFYGCSDYPNCRFTKNFK